MREPRPGSSEARTSAPQRLTAMASARVTSGSPSTPLLKSCTGMRIKTRDERRRSIIARVVAMFSSPVRREPSDSM